MIGRMALSYVFFCGALLMLAVLGLESAVTTSGLDRWSKRFFTAFFAVLVPVPVLFCLETAAIDRPDLTIPLVIVYFFGSVLCAVPFPMLSVYLLHCCGEDWRGSSLFRAMMAPFGLFLVLLCAAQFKKWNEAAVLAQGQVEHIREVIEKTRVAREFLRGASDELLEELRDPQRWREHEELGYVFDMNELF